MVKSLDGDSVLSADIDHSDGSSISASSSPASKASPSPPARASNAFAGAAATAKRLGSDDASVSFSDAGSEKKPAFTKPVSKPSAALSASSKGKRGDDDDDDASVSFSDAGSVKKGPTTASKPMIGSTPLRADTWRNDDDAASVALGGSSKRGKAAKAHGSMSFSDTASEKGAVIARAAAAAAEAERKRMEEEAAEAAAAEAERKRREEEEAEAERQRLQRQREEEERRRQQEEEEAEEEQRRQQQKKEQEAEEEEAEAKSEAQQQANGGGEATKPWLVQQLPRPATPPTAPPSQQHSRPATPPAAPPSQQQPLPATPPAAPRPATPPSQQQSRPHSPQQAPPAPPAPPAAPATRREQRRREREAYLEGLPGWNRFRIVDDVTEFEASCSKCHQALDPGASVCPACHPGHSAGEEEDWIISDEGVIYSSVAGKHPSEGVREAALQELPMWPWHKHIELYTALTWSSLKEQIIVMRSRDPELWPWLRNVQPYFKCCLCGAKHKHRAPLVRRK